MTSRQTSALFIGTSVCALILVLNHFGAFAALSLPLERALQAHLLLPAGLLHSVPLQFCYHTVMAFFTAWVCLELRQHLLRLAFMVGAIYLSLTLVLVMAFQGMLFEPFSGILAIVLAGATALVVGSSVRGRLVHEFRCFFVDRLAEEPFAQLIEKREPTRLSGQREITALTFKLVNAGTISQSVRPDPMAMLSASVMKTISEFLIGHGAYIERCSAHGVVALFGFPVASQDHAQQACLAVAELRPMLTKLAHEVRTRWMCEAHFGIGIASGKVMCGLYGHGGFQSYGAIGEAVEMSGRLSSLNAVYGSRVLLAESTLLRVMSIIEARPIGIVPSATLPDVEVGVHEWLAAKGRLSEEENISRDRFTEGVNLLRAGQATQAAAKLKQALLPDHEDAPLRYFIALAKTLLNSATAPVQPTESESGESDEVEPQEQLEAPAAKKSSLKPIVIGAPAARSTSTVTPLKTLVTGVAMVKSDFAKTTTTVIADEVIVEETSSATRPKETTASTKVAKEAKPKAKKSAKSSS